MAETGDLITRIYANFRGADFRGEEINIVRSPDCLNVWKDYRETESIRTRPGMRLDVAFDEPVYGIFFFNGTKIVHSGNKLYRVSNNAKTVLFSGVRAYKSQAFAYGKKLYIKDGMHYLVFDGTTIKDVEGYVPTTSIARKPSDSKTAGGGTIHEDVNLLTGRRINTFLGDGEKAYLWLDAQNIDEDFVPIVKINGEVLQNSDTQRILVNYKNGWLRYQTYRKDPGWAAYHWDDAGLPKPLTDGQDNISVEFRKTVAGYSDRIHKCTLLQVFDNRVFFSGNPDFPNVVYHCSLDDPTYCSDLDYYNEGLDTAAVRGLVAGNNVLWVFREPSSANTTVFYHTPTIDSEYGKIYPSQHSSVTTGCIGKAINFNDDIVFFSERGMEGISGDITTEQVVAHRSSLVDRKLLASDNYRDMVLEEWEGYLLVFLGNRVFLADSRTAFTNENHIEYDWFYWELDRDVYSTCVKDGVLYIGANDGVYTLNDNEKDIESYWVTPKDKFKAPQKLKTTNKRGCVVEATGDISVYAKVEDTDFEPIGSYENITDYIACRIKRKKWKDIQLKFHSQTRFSLETATLEAFVGGYIKR